MPDSSPLSAVHVIAGLGPRFGGPSYYVPRLCAALTDAGCDTSIVTVEGSEPVAAPGISAFAQDFRDVPILSELRQSSGLRKAIDKLTGKADLVHVHGLWLMPNVYAGRAAASARKPLVVTPHGSLAPAALRKSAMRKRLFWHLLQGPAYRHAAAWHANSAAEQADIAGFGVKAPVRTIPIGVDLPAALARHDPAKPRRTLLFLSRVHPHKNVRLLIGVWARLAQRHRDWDLVIAGSGEARHVEEIVSFAGQIPNARISFTGPVGPELKSELLRDADLFVLPSRSEGFGIAVSEALAAGVPAVVTRGVPWHRLEPMGCGWWIEESAAALEAALSQAMTLSASERQAMGLNGRTWMKREFGWPAIAERMLDLYREVSDPRADPKEA